MVESLCDALMGSVFKAGLDLNCALGLIDDEHAAGKVRDAISTLDRVVSQLRVAAFVSAQGSSVVPAPVR